MRKINENNKEKKKNTGYKVSVFNIRQPAGGSFQEFCHI